MIFARSNTRAGSVNTASSRPCDGFFIAAAFVLAGLLSASKLRTTSWISSARARCASSASSRSPTRTAGPLTRVTFPLSTRRSSSIGSYRSRISHTVWWCCDSSSLAVSVPPASALGTSSVPRCSAVRASVNNVCSCPISSVSVVGFGRCDVMMMMIQYNIGSCEVREESKRQTGSGLVFNNARRERVHKRSSIEALRPRKGSRKRASDAVFHEGLCVCFNAKRRQSVRKTDERREKTEKEREGRDSSDVCQGKAGEVFKRKRK